jgi:type VI secretion system protein ImpA
LSWQDHENSALLDDATLTPERRQELVDAGIVGGGAWSAALAGTGKAALGEIIDALDASLERTREIASFCGERFGDEEAPDFYNLRNLLEEIRDYLRPHAGGESAAEASESFSTAMEEVSVTTGGRIGSRAQALRALQDVGEYFRRAEPHSPISYLISRAVRWGSMPLDQLLRDVIRNDDVIGQIWETLGLDGRPAASAADEGSEE